MAQRARPAQGRGADITTRDRGTAATFTNPGINTPVRKTFMVPAKPTRIANTRSQFRRAPTSGRVV